MYSMRTCELLCPCNTVFGYLRKFNNTVNFGCESRIEGSLKQEPLIKCNEGYFSVNHLGELNMTNFNNCFIAFFFIIQIVFLSGCASTPEQVENNERYNDMVITTKVHEAIIDDLSLRPFEINVRTRKGVCEFTQDGAIINWLKPMNSKLSELKMLSEKKMIFVSCNLLSG